MKISRLISMMLCLIMVNTAIYAQQIIALDLEKSGEIIPLKRLLEIVQLEYPGRILQTGFISAQGKHFYALEILDKTGVIRELKINAVTGKFIYKGREVYDASITSRR